MSLTWTCEHVEHGPRGEQCVRYVCEEYPTLVRLEQRQSPEQAYCVTYHLGDLPQHWHDEGAALDALRANT